MYTDYFLELNLSSQDMELNASCPELPKQKGISVLYLSEKANFYSIIKINLKI